MPVRSMLIGLLVTLCCGAFANQAHAAESVGQVLSVVPGAFAERGGKSVPLALKSPVYANDILMTDATGKVQVLFTDDSSLSLAPKTRLALESVVPKGTAPKFKASVSEGMARFITGKIVEQNPEGFSVMTPETTIGIRGTIFAVQRDQSTGSTSVYVLNTARQVVVNGINVPGDHKLTLPGGRVAPMTPADRKLVTACAAVRTPPVRADGKAPREFAALWQPDMPGPSAALASSLLLTQRGGGAPTNSITGSSSMNGNITGTLSGGGITGAFSFNADLGSGSITGAAMSGSGGGTSLNASGGTGYINPSRFGVNRFPSGTFNYNGGANSYTNAKIYGNVEVQGPSVNVNGDFGVYGRGGNKVLGTASGGN